ncbi:putative membrane protein [Desulfosporosinus sp. OT]|nr:putative membrane protein [Desulfosporosinus sp. OT]
MWRIFYYKRFFDLSKYSFFIKGNLYVFFMLLMYFFILYLLL